MIRTLRHLTIVSACLLGMLSAHTASAGALQLAASISFLNVPNGPMEQDDDVDLAFGLTVNDVVGTTVADVDGSTAGANFDYSFETFATVTNFDKLNQSTFVTGSGPTVGAINALSEVAIITDEFANTSNFPQTATARIAVHPASLEIDNAVNAIVAYQILLLTTNLGNVGASTTEETLLDRLGGPIDEFEYFLTGLTGVATDSGGNAEFLEDGFSLNATFNATEPSVDVPLSVRNFNLGVLEPGDRLAVGYITVLQSALGSGENAFAMAASPRTSPPLLDVRLQRVPEPGTGLLLIVTVLVALARGRRRAA